jgi:hypothetical protein
MEVLTTLQHLPIPLLVLSPEKTVIFASETMITLLGVDLGCTTTNEILLPTVLKNRHMEELGIDILECGVQKTISWEVCRPFRNETHQ